LRALKLDYHASETSEDGPWRARCPICRTTTLPDDPLPLTITRTGHISCRNRCDPAKIAEALDNATSDNAEPPSRTELEFMSAADLKAYAPLEPAWIWGGYLAPGGLTMLGGRPKAGKSTFAGD
jgi:hypothetical protein